MDDNHRNTVNQYSASKIANTFRIFKSNTYIANSSVCFIEHNLHYWKGLYTLTHVRTQGMKISVMINSFNLAEEEVA